MTECPSRELSENPTRQRIVRAAVELVDQEDSIDAVSIEEIAERAGVSRRTFFNYMPGKLTALLIPLFDMRSHFIQEVVDAPAELDVWEVLRYGIDQAFSLCDDVYLVAQSERILTNLVHSATSTEIPNRQPHEAHTRALTDELSRRLGRDDPVATALLANIGNYVLRLALRTIYAGGDPTDVITHAFNLLHLSHAE